MILDKLQLWWAAWSVLEPLNWAMIALGLFLYRTAQYSRFYKAVTFPGKEEVSEMFLSMGTIYGVFNIIYVIWRHLPFSEAKSGIFYLFATLVPTVVEQSTKLPLNFSIAPYRQSANRQPSTTSKNIAPPPDSPHV
jgi:hypothetical protein